MGHSRRCPDPRLPLPIRNAPAICRAGAIRHAANSGNLCRRKAPTAAGRRGESWRSRRSPGRRGAATDAGVLQQRSSGEYYCKTGSFLLDCAPGLAGVLPGADMKDSYLFTSESVSEGHPDKVCDQISDAVLDAILTQDRAARVACETLVKNNLVMLAGEITTRANIDFDKVARDVIRTIGYNDAMGFGADSCTVLTAIGKQSPHIAQGVDEGKGLDLDQGAGDQGLMFGYATNETDVLMPMPITLAHRLVKRQAEVRKNGKLTWLRPDAKSQVTVKYVDNKPAGIDSVVLSTQ